MDDFSHSEHFDVEKSFVTNEQDGSTEHDHAFFNQQVYSIDGVQIEKQTVEVNHEILLQSDGQVDGVLACQPAENCSCREIGDDDSAGIGVNEITSNTLTESRFVVEEHAEETVSEQLNVETCSTLNSSDGIRAGIEGDKEAVPLFDQRPQDVNDKPVRWEEEPVEQVIQPMGQETNVVKLYNEKNDIEVRDLSTLERDQMSTLGEAFAEQIDHEELIFTQEKSEVDSGKEDQPYIINDHSHQTEVEIEQGTVESVTVTTEVIKQEIESTQDSMDISNVVGNGEADILVSGGAISANMESTHEESIAQNGEASEFSLDYQTGKVSSSDEDNVDCHETTTKTTELQTVESTTSETTSTIVISGVSESVTIVESTETVEEKTSCDEDKSEDVDDTVVEESNAAEGDTCDGSVDNATSEVDLEASKDSETSSSSSSSDDSSDDESKKESENVIVAVPITITTPSEDSEIDSENATPGIGSDGENDDEKEIDLVLNITDKTCEDSVTESTTVVEKSEEGESTVTTETVSSHVDESGVETIVTETVITTIVKDHTDGEETTTETMEDKDEVTTTTETKEGDVTTVVTTTESVEADGTTVVTTTEVVEADGGEMVTSVETFEVSESTDAAAESVEATEVSEEQSEPAEAVKTEELETITVVKTVEAVETPAPAVSEDAKETSSSSSSEDNASDDEKEKKKEVEVAPTAAEVADETVEKDEGKTVEISSETVTEVSKMEEATTVQTITTTETVESKDGETVTVVETVTTIVEGESKDIDEKTEEKADGEETEGAAVLHVDNPDEITIAQAKEDETKPLIVAEESEPAKAETNVKPGENGKQQLDDSDKETTTLLKKDAAEKPLKEEEDCSCCTLM